MSGVDQYDKLIPAFGTTGNKWPQMRLFLNMVKDNYEATGSVRFASKKYDEVDARSYRGATSDDGTVSNQFACFLNELLNLINNRTISTTVGAVSTYPNAATAAVPAGFDSRAPVGTIVGGTVGIVGGSKSANEVLRAVKDAEPEFFRELMSTITTGRFDDINASFTFKIRADIIRDLDIKNLFTGLRGTGNMDFRSPGAGRVGLQADMNRGAVTSVIDTASMSPGEADRLLAGYAVGVTDSDCQSYAGAGVPISFNWDKYVLGHLLKSALKTASSRSSDFFKNVGPSAPHENAYYRKVGDSKNLYTLVNGVETAVQIGSDAAKKIKMGQNCYDLGMRSNDAATQAKCYDLIKNCLAGDKIERCKEFMRTSDYWTTVKMDVANLNLDLGKELLLSFGFPVMSEDNKESGRKLQVFGNSTQWLQYISETKFKNTTFGAKDIKKIAANTKLTGYLDLVASKLNQNPGVLNPDYAKDAPTVNATAFQGSTLNKYGLGGKYVTQGSGVTSVASIAQMKALATRYRSALGIFYGIPTGLTGYVMRGGAGAATQQFEDLQNNSINPLRLSAMVEQHYTSFVNNLKGANKDLDSKDKTDIEGLISELKVLEDKLFKAAIYTSKYQDLVSVFGEEDTNGLITLDHLQQFVDKRNNYFLRTGKKQDALTSILQALASATQKETKNVSVTVSKYPTSPVKGA